MSEPIVTVDGNRLREHVETNATFGSVADGRGRTVLTGSSADRDAREYLLGEFDRLGLDVTVDAVGNLAGRWTPESARPDARPVATGSHLDSVPRGGWFDGPLGVYAALEAVEAIKESGLEPTRPLEVVSFTEEEGTRFGVGLLGSSVAAGLRSPASALALEDGAGETLETRLESIGFRGQGRLDATGWDAWLELHVEQSTALEDAGCRAGIVTAITGLEQYTVTFVGEADHAGGTRMGDRRDALRGAAAFVEDIGRGANELAADNAPFAVATVGSVSVEPNATNVVPGRVELGLDIRDVEGEVIDELRRRAERSLARIEANRDLETDLERRHGTRPAAMSRRCRRALEEAGRRADVPSMELPSGGGHDTMNVARVTDAGLLFVPSVDGVSHSPEEWTDWEDCRAGAQVLASALADLSGAEPE